MAVKLDHANRGTDSGIPTFPKHNSVHNS